MNLQAKFLNMMKLDFLTLVCISIFLSSCVSNYAVKNKINIYQSQLASTNKSSTHSKTFGLKPYRPIHVRGLSASKPLVFEPQPIAYVKSNESDVTTYKELEDYYNIETLLKTARGYLGTKYRFGGNSRAGIDCSSLVMKSFSVINYQLPRTSREQSKLGDYVNPDDLRKGDLLFFANRGRISHVGIVESIDKEHGIVYFIHAASSLGVTISSLNDPYWSKRFRFAKRLIGADDPEVNLLMNK